MKRSVWSINEDKTPWIPLTFGLESTRGSVPHVLLRFPSLDIATRRDEANSGRRHGIHHGTALSGCHIVAGYATDAYLSCDRGDEKPVELGYDGILTCRENHFQILPHTTTYAIELGISSDLPPITWQELDS